MYGKGASKKREFVVREPDNYELLHHSGVKRRKISMAPPNIRPLGMYRRWPSLYSKLADRVGAKAAKFLNV
jgi:hypothetical protein